MGAGSLLGRRRSTPLQVIPVSATADATRSVKNNPVAPIETRATDEVQADEAVEFQVVSTVGCVGTRSASHSQQTEQRSDVVVEAQGMAVSMAKDASKDKDGQRQLMLQEANFRRACTVESKGSEVKLGSKDVPLTNESSLLQRRKSGAGRAGLGLKIDATKLGTMREATSQPADGDATPKLRVAPNKVYALDDCPSSPKRTLGAAGEIPKQFNKSRRGSAPY